MKTVSIFNTVIFSNHVKRFSYYKTVPISYTSVITYWNCGEETKTVDISNNNEKG